VTQEGVGKFAHLASTLMGVPMLTQTLQDANSMLQHLVGLQDAPEDLLIKLDTRRARFALLEYLADTERVLTSPSLSCAYYIYFTKSRLPVCPYKTDLFRSQPQTTLARTA
jgi:hypothetical protein